MVAFIPVVVSNDLANFKLLLCEFLDLIASLPGFPCFLILDVVRFSNVKEFAVFFVIRFFLLKLSIIKV